MKIHRRIVFIHDKYIFASIINHSIIRDLLTYYLSTTRDMRIEYKALDSLAWLSTDKELSDLLAHDLYERLEMSGSREYRVEELVEYVKTYPSTEYVVRAYPRNILVSLIEKGFAWFIPFRNIRKLAIRRLGGKNYIEIIYTCPFTRGNRVFRTYYDPETYELIKQLCLFNNNRNCS